VTLDGVSQVRAVLETTPARWLNLAELLPVDLLDRVPAPGEWSALGCLRHLLTTEQRVFPVRLQAFLAGDEFLANFDPDAPMREDGSLTSMEIAREFARLRADSLTVLARVTTGDLACQAHHAELGRVTLGELLHEWAAHDLMHTVQAERALMQAFLPGTGPWRLYFQDYDITAQRT
jgi:hypothetical protein